MRFFIEKKKKNKEEEIKDITAKEKSKCKKEIIKLMTEGAPKKYYPDFVKPDGKKISREGEELEQHDIVAITTKNIFKGREYYHKVLEIFQEVIEEREKLLKIDISKYKDANDYKKKVAEISSDIDATEWYHSILEYFESESYSDLKEKMKSGNEIFEAVKAEEEK